ncbi:unnamed protein product [Protopolystoma xenopodis]|uniref:Uncharacterized protein n=1 Tax=Protopolystoma xenopodis TaxID=117903 RepID=A0A3S5APG5_9PLAT|nr:unnamed protein product [Protopolystoma xenopodis]
MYFYHIQEQWIDCAQSDPSADILGSPTLISTSGLRSLNRTAEEALGIGHLLLAGSPPAALMMAELMMVKADFDSACTHLTLLLNKFPCKRRVEGTALLITSMFYFVL